MTLKAPIVLYIFLFNIMSKSVALGMLRQGQTGAQILEILNAIVADLNNNQEEEIQF